MKCGLPPIPRIKGTPVQPFSSDPPVIKAFSCAALRRRRSGELTGEQNKLRSVPRSAAPPDLSMLVGHGARGAALPEPWVTVSGHQSLWFWCVRPWLRTAWHA